MTEFFTQLIEALEKESLRRPGMGIDAATLEELNSSAQQNTSPAKNAPAEKPPVQTSVMPSGDDAPPWKEVPPRPAPVPQPRFEERRAPVPAPVPAPPVPAQAPLPAPPVNTPQKNLVPGTLEHLCETVRNCRNCPLCETRLNAVPGEGNPKARLMFIGEGPGADEDRQGRPFVGAAGQLLDKMIAAMQLRREDVYIANVVKCRPPRNRAPMPEEANACIGYLEHQIRMIRPEVIVLLGATAAHFLLQREEGIMRLRGRWLEYDGIPVMPTFHPAFLLRQESAKREAWEDLKQVMGRLGIPIPVPRRAAR